MLIRLLKHTSKILTISIIFAGSLCAQKYAGAISPDSLVGNVYGTVKDSATGQPISGAQIYLFTKPLQKAVEGNTVATNAGTFKLPEISSAVKQTVTGKNGKFLINFVKTPAPYKLYTIIIKANGYNDFIINQAPVMPGAVMSLNVSCLLNKNKNKSQFYDGRIKNGPFIYADELMAKSFRLNHPLKSKLNRPQDVQYMIYATREGLAGHSTANGHVIKSHDHFVALPSFRVLNKNDKTYDFEVKLTCGNRTVTAPVWDVGPWNVKDDYWNPDTLREIYKTLHHGGKPGLGEGVPEAMAAYYYNYNQDWSGDFSNTGADHYQVKLPAGIDLADGTFWDDLNLPDNGWIKVNYLWRPGVSVGDTVTATDSLPVTFGAAGLVIGNETKGNEGVIIGGPQSGTYNGTYYIWWKIDWENGLSGWSFEKYLKKKDNGNINVTFKTVPDSLTISADGKKYTTPYTFNWAPNSQHSISAVTQISNSNDAKYIWLNWSDKRLNPHNIYPYSNTTYTAYYKIQYKLDVTLAPLNGGYISPYGATWEDKDKDFTITATPADGYKFVKWTGDTTSTDNPLHVKLTKPFSVAANFHSLTAVDENAGNTPKSYSLYQNYPNPFNPSTTIKYALPLESRVKIIIYNSLGMAVDELINQTEDAGIHEIIFNGNKLSSGVYFCKIDAEAVNGTKRFEKSSKLILMK